MFDVEKISPEDQRLVLDLTQRILAADRKATLNSFAALGNNEHLKLELLMNVSTVMFAGAAFSLMQNTEEAQDRMMSQFRGPGGAAGMPEGEVARLELILDLLFIKVKDLIGMPGDHKKAKLDLVMRIIQAAVKYGEKPHG